MADIIRAKFSAAGICVLLWILISLPAFAQQQEWADTIVVRDEKEGNRNIEGSVTKETYDKITYILPDSGGTATGGVPTLQVVEIQYDENSKTQDFKKAEGLFEAGRWKEAADIFQKAAKSMDTREAFKQHRLYKLAVCHENMGNSEKAVAAYQELLVAFPDSRFLREAHEGIINGLVAKGKFNEAEKAAGDAEKQAKTMTNLDVPFKLKIEFLKGRILEEKKLYPDAARQYQRAAADATLEIAGEARLGIGRCHMGDNNLDAAEAEFRKITAEFKGARADYIKAGAWNGVGDVFRKRTEAIQGVAPEKVQLFEKALWSHLRGVIYWDKVKASVKWTGKVDEFAKAMYYSARCFDTLKDAYRADKAQMDLYRTRAQQLYEETATEFRGTKWGEEAAKMVRR